MSRTFFILSREIFDSAIWREDPHVLKLFLYLIGVARHDKKPKKYPTFEIGRGERVTSLAEIAEDNEYHENGAMKRWSRQRVLRMLDKLEKGGYIKRISDTYGTHIKICNYEIYQDVGRYKADTSGTGAERGCDAGVTGADINNNGNNGDNENNGRERPAKKPKREPEQIDKELSRALYEKINELDPTYFSSATKKALDKWPDLFRLMRQQDGRDPAEIRAVIDGLDRDGFWADKIRSPKALRGETKTGGDKFKKIQADLGTAPKKTEYFNGHTWDTDD
jgi:hypothetical protein